MKIDVNIVYALPCLYMVDLINMQYCDTYKHPSHIILLKYISLLTHNLVIYCHVFRRTIH